MKDAMHGAGSPIAIRREGQHRPRRRMATSCSICTRHIWLDSHRVIEPEGVPEPRLSWMLCKECYGAVLAELRRSPVRSSLRVRIAMGIVASERWPLAYPTRLQGYISDHRWIVFISVGFLIAMIVHLVLIVMVAGMR